MKTLTFNSITDMIGRVRGQNIVGVAEVGLALAGAGRAAPIAPWPGAIRAGHEVGLDRVPAAS